MRRSVAVRGTRKEGRGRGASTGAPVKGGNKRGTGERRREAGKETRLRLRRGAASEGRGQGARGKATGREDAPVGDVLLPVLTEGELQREAEWLGRTIALWLDEEWCPQQVHADIGDTLCRAYLDERGRGNNEATSILLQLSDDLMKVDFTEAFVNPFDVSNKALECLMFKSGIDVCCQSEQDKKFLEDRLKEA
ncbi:hypothetical protein HOP50_02g19640 [Chloropicon primus]|uniref:Uncharacterized protein n=2 Tax=Chloropicon primus TaxID=1764295 RepID=A0A5B8MGA5_9CHLO|nr:hypothetical protein A3770_02p19670 [Chloropicon primus]UPQ98658.1 hypothetical protein HOP50_02g19640 [Chloropicon primus]|eukprot:QDZ19449.1 hypothetical protein A3770_02p19670 [Chloropicon primus]